MKRKDDCPPLASATALSLGIGCTALFLVLATQVDVSANQDYPPDRVNLHSLSAYASDASSKGIASNPGTATPGTKYVAQQAVFKDMSTGRTAPSEGSRSESPARELVSNQEMAENISPDWNGIWRDTGMLIGSQIVAAGIIYTMPESVSSWSSEQKRNTFKKYAANVFDPVIDKDKFYINYILHPYWGATYYIRGRERGLDKVPALVYSALISAMYEFGVECFFEKPSIQDLIITPVAGSLLGAILFEPWRESIKRKQGLRWYDHAALVVTDPVGVLSLGIEKLFGIKSTIMVDYSVPHLQKSATGSAAVSSSRRIGVTFQFPFI